MKSTTKQPLNGNGLVQLVEVGNFIRLKRVKHILLPNMIQQWGWVTSSHSISYDPCPS